MPTNKPKRKMPFVQRKKTPAKASAHRFFLDLCLDLMTSVTFTATTAVSSIYITLDKGLRDAFLRGPPDEDKLPEHELARYLLLANLDGRVLSALNASTSVQKDDITSQPLDVAKALCKPRCPAPVTNFLQTGMRLLERVEAHHRITDYGVYHGLIAEKATGTLHVHGAPHVDKNSSMEAAAPIDEAAPGDLPPLVVQDDLGLLANTASDVSNNVGLANDSLSETLADMHNGAVPQRQLSAIELSDYGTRRGECRLQLDDCAGVIPDHLRVRCPVNAEHDTGYCTVCLRSVFLSTRMSIPRVNAEEAVALEQQRYYNKVPYFCNECWHSDEMTLTIFDGHEEDYHHKPCGRPSNHLGPCGKPCATPCDGKACIFHDFHALKPCTSVLREGSFHGEFKRTRTSRASSSADYTV